MTQKSKDWLERAERRIPGGVNSPVRAFRAVGGEPPFISHGSGARLFDVEGNSYIDYVCSWGPLILGHAHPEIVAALEQAARRGTSFGAPTPLEVELAEAICAAFPSIEKVRLVNSGTEATMSAIRLARGHTGREMIVKFAGNYHGHVDSLLVAAGSSAATLNTDFAWERHPSRASPMVSRLSFTASSMKPQVLTITRSAPSKVLEVW